MIYGSQKNVVSAWSGYLRAGIEVSVSSETDTSITYAFNGIGQVINYHGFPHHTFSVIANGVTYVNQTDHYTSGTYPGNNIWYTSSNQNYSNTITIEKTSSTQTVYFTANFGLAYAYIEPSSGVAVGPPQTSTASTSVTVPAIANFIASVSKGTGISTAKVNNSTTSVSITPGTSVTYTATASSGYYFDGWYIEPDLVSTANPYTFTPTGNVSLMAKSVTSPSTDAVNNAYVNAGGTWKYGMVWINDGGTWGLKLINDPNVNAGGTWV